MEKEYAILFEVRHVFNENKQTKQATTKPKQTIPTQTNKQKDELRGKKKYWLQKGLVFYEKYTPMMAVQKEGTDLGTNLVSGNSSELCRVT